MRCRTLLNMWPNGVPIRFDYWSVKPDPIPDPIPDKTQY
jgi:hypothetical protein